MALPNVCLQLVPNVFRLIELNYSCCMISRVVLVLVILTIGLCIGIDM